MDFKDLLLITNIKKSGKWAIHIADTQNAPMCQGNAAVKSNWALLPQLDNDKVKVGHNLCPECYRKTQDALMTDEDKLELHLQMRRIDSEVNRKLRLAKQAITGRR